MIKSLKKEATVAIVLILVMIATNNPVMRGFFNGIKEKFRKSPEQPAEKGGVSHE